MADNLQTANPLPPLRKWRWTTGRLPAIADTVRQALLATIDLILLRTLPRYRNRPNRLCAVRIDNIGDFLLWHASARDLRRLHPAPDWRLTLVANKIWADLARQTGLFDEVIELDVIEFARLRSLLRPGRLRHRRDFLRTLRMAGFEMTLYPACSRAYEGNLIVRATGSAHRIALRGDTANQSPLMRWWTSRWYTQLAPDPPPGTLSELEINAHFMRWLGAAAARPEIAPLEIPLASASAEVRSLIQEAPAILVFPGVSLSIKRWPVERFAAIARLAHQRIGGRIWICGGLPEQALGAALQDRCAGLPVVNLVGKTSLPDLAALIRSAALVVTNDTVAIHMAAASGTPGIAILGGGHFGRFLPYPSSVAGSPPRQRAVFQAMDCFHCGWHCKYRITRGDPAPCVAAVDVAMVERAIDEILAIKP